MSVALLAEGVDRNKIAKYYADLEQVVALLAEGVDRNIFWYAALFSAYRVALLAEGVDRNRPCCRLLGAGCWSPSSRRAWIEMS